MDKKEEKAKEALNPMGITPKSTRTLSFFSRCPQFPDLPASSSTGLAGGLREGPSDQQAVDPSHAKTAPAPAPAPALPTKEFLEACASIVSFVEFLGSVFSPVKSDIQGNVDKLWLSFNDLNDQRKGGEKKEGEEEITLNEILEREANEFPGDEFKVATDALLWLSRALLYIHTFLSLFLDDYNLHKQQLLESSGDDRGSPTTPTAPATAPHPSSSLSSLFSSAYSLTLKKHHNWFVQKIFALCLLAAPSREQLLTLLEGRGDLSNPPLEGQPRREEQEEAEAVLFHDIQSFASRLKFNTCSWEYYINKGKGSGHGFYPTPLAIFYGKDISKEHKRDLDIVVNRALEHGFLMKYQNELADSILGEIPSPPKPVEGCFTTFDEHMERIGPYSGQAVTSFNMKGAFILWAVGVMAAAITLILEIKLHFVKKQLIQMLIEFSIMRVKVTRIAIRVKLILRRRMRVFNEKRQPTSGDDDMMTGPNFRVLSDTDVEGIGTIDKGSSGSQVLRPPELSASSVAWNRIDFGVLRI